MRVSEITCVKDTKCNECGKLLKKYVDTRWGIIPSKSGGIVLCKYCFADFKEKVNNIWVYL